MKLVSFVEVFTVSDDLRNNVFVATKTCSPKSPAARVGSPHSSAAADPCVKSRGREIGELELILNT